MKSLIAIALLTWKAAFRFRLFWVLAVLLLGSVIGLPLLLKDDGTARGFIQILLTYNLSIITALMGFSTLWLSCGTLARDIEECQIQVLAVKPVSRWQIWLGKWVGIMMLNTALLAVTGVSVYGLLQYRSTKLPEEQQQILKDEVFVARASLKEPPPNLETARDRIFRQRLEQTPLDPTEHQAVRDQIMEQLKAGLQVVPPNHYRTWEIDLGLHRHLLKDEPLFLRFKFHAAQTNATGTYVGAWEVGPPDSPLGSTYPMRLAPNSFHEIQVPPNLYDQNGLLRVQFINQDNTALLFTLEEGFEVLFRQGNFGLNFLRGLLVMLSWLGLLAALGLATASFLSFPVAAFCSISLMIVALSSGTLSGVVEEQTVTGRDHETGQALDGVALIDAVLIPIFHGILKIVGLIQETSPIDALSTGRSITWTQLSQAWVQVMGLLGGLAAAGGITMFYRRELALPQGSN